MRHAESTANLFHMVVSLPIAGIASAGLTARGRAQVVAAAHKVRSEIAVGKTAIYSSDFLRAIESATLLADEVGLPGIETDPSIATQLRERNFGVIEGLSSSLYTAAWEADALGQTLAGVEPVSQVLIRMHRAIELLEARYLGFTLILVSHGDPLQILLADNIHGSAMRHRELPNIQNAEIRSYPGTQP